MDKFESKAKELLAEVEHILSAEKESSSSTTEIYGGFKPPIGAYHFEFLSIVLRIQSLFYCTDPDMPMYRQSLELGKDWTKGASLNDYELLRLMLQTYLEFLDFYQK